MEDSRIVALYWSRSEEAILQTQQKYGPYCRTVAWNILADAEDAEECVNDTWLRAWNAMPPHRPSRLSVFLGKLTRNLALNRWEARRAQKRGGGRIETALEELEQCLPAAGDPQTALEHQALTDSLNRFLASLSPDRRHLFLARYWYLCPIEELAKRRGTSKSQVTSLLFRLRNQLRLHLEKEGFAV